MVNSCALGGSAWTETECAQRIVRKSECRIELWRGRIFMVIVPILSVSVDESVRFRKYKVTYVYCRNKR